MNIDGWTETVLLEKQCRLCANVLIQQRLCACVYGLPEFPAATHCNQFDEVEYVAG